MVHLNDEPITVATARGKRKLIKTISLFAASIGMSFLCVLLTAWLFRGAKGVPVRTLLGNLAAHALLLLAGLCAAGAKAKAQGKTKMGYAQAWAWLNGFLLIPGAVLVLVVLIFTKTIELYPILLPVIGFTLVSLAYHHMDKALHEDEKIIAYLQARGKKNLR